MTKESFLKRFPLLQNGVFIMDFQEEEEMRACGVASFAKLTQDAFALPDLITTVWNVLEKGVPSMQDIGSIRLVIGTGSTHDTRENLPWMIQSKSLFKEIAANEIYIIGTCFTHQLLAEAYGGKVDNNPRGVEFGNTVLAKNEIARDHFLFKDIPDFFVLNLSHGDSIIIAQPEWQVLASSELCENQIIAFAPNVIGLQGHVEFTNSVMSSLVNAASMQTWLRKKGKPEISFKILEESFRAKANEKFAKQIIQNLLAWANGEHSYIANEFKTELQVLSTFHSVEGYN
jgi:GMP synthase-like glutamine amidotransferase